MNSVLTSPPRIPAGRRRAWSALLGPKAADQQAGGDHALFGRAASLSISSHCSAIRLGLTRCPINRPAGKPWRVPAYHRRVSASPARPPTPSTLSNQPPSAERSAAEARSTSPVRQLRASARQKGETSVCLQIAVSRAPANANTSATSNKPTKPSERNDQRSSYRAGKGRLRVGNQYHAPHPGVTPGYGPVPMLRVVNPLGRAETRCRSTALGHLGHSCGSDLGVVSHEFDEAIDITGERG
jgi:hypothetical protein